MSFYYIVGEDGQAVGPYPAAWVRQNAQEQTLVSHQQQWLTFAVHPDFREVQRVNLARPGLVRRIVSWWNDASAVGLLVAAVCFSTLTMTVNTLLLHEGRGLVSEFVQALYISLVWLLVFACFLILAYAIGRLFGGRASARDVFHGFARTIFVLYVAIPTGLFTYTMWFKWLWDNHIILALLFLLVQVLFCAVCLHLDRVQRSAHIREIYGF